MTTPTQPTPAQIEAEQFRAEIRATLKTIQSRIEQTTDRVMMIENIQADERNTLDELTKAIETVLHGIQHAATATPPTTNSGQFTEMMIDNIIMTYSDKGEPAYKATGTPYNKFGVRVWPETLPTLGIDPASLKPGPNPQPAPIKASVLMQVNEEGKASPRKITGKA